MPPTSAICIYCRSEKDIGDFNREHVVPKSFGGFADAPVLHQTVCTECNDYFGSTLDLRLARESLEGVERFQWGAKKPEEVDKLRYEGIRLTARVGGDYEGCLLRLVQDPNAPGKIAAVPMAQVGFANASDDGFTFLTIDEFFSDRWLDDASLAPHKGVKIIETDEKAVVDRLRSKGIEHTEWKQIRRPNDDSEIDIDQVIRITDEHLRGIAKIAFNYMAYRHGAAFALREEFDSTRRYIRYGRLPFLPAVHIRREEIFRPFGIGGDDERAVAHMVTVLQPDNADVTLGQVTLYNWMRYDVVLAHSALSGLNPGGIFLDPRGKKVYELGRSTASDSG